VDGAKTVVLALAMDAVVSEIKGWPQSSLAQDFTRSNVAIPTFKAARGRGTSIVCPGQVSAGAGCLPDLAVVRRSYTMWWGEPEKRLVWVEEKKGAAVRWSFSMSATILPS
jgi:hypothetical protein